MAEYDGIVFIGDPHAASKVIGFRKDDYPQALLGKLDWCLAYAEENNLLPVCLGDLFHHPRDNANWLLSDLISKLAGREFYGIYGNHDVREGAITEDDSLSVLVSAGVYKMLTVDRPWRGLVGGKQIAIHGISWNRPITGIVHDPEVDLVILLTHHDIGFPGYDQGRIAFAELEGVDIVVNGHIHRRLDPRKHGKTLWVNPGNIVRVSRSDMSQSFTPSVLTLRMVEDQPVLDWVTVPHLPFEDVFYEAAADPEAVSGSAFVHGLAELQARRTETGAGLREFLDANLHQFEDPIRLEIESLAAEALGT